MYIPIVKFPVIKKMKFEKKVIYICLNQRGRSLVDVANNQIIKEYKESFYLNFS